MKLQPLLLAMLLTLIALQPALAEKSMLVHFNGETTAYTLSDIQKITFDLDPNSVHDYDKIGSIVEGFKLKGNYPNPFNPTTNISYQLDKAGDVELVIFDVSGRQVTRLVTGNQKAGAYDVTWDGKASNGVQAPTGAYFYQLSLDDQVQVKKMLLIK